MNLNEIQSYGNAIGKLHPLVVHFPISIPFLLLLLEFIILKKGRSDFQMSTRILLFISVATSCFSVLFGLILYWNQGDESEIIQKHMWTGIVSCFFITCALIAYLFQEFKSYQIFLVLSVVSVSIAGHFGGTMVRNTDHSEAIEIQSSPSVADTLVKTDSLSLLSQQALQIIKKRCISCHGPKKSKGKLRLDNMQFALKGGKNGPALLIGNAAKSEMIRRVKLPSSDDEAMPTKGKRLTNMEIQLLEKWINTGINYKNNSPIQKVQKPALLDLEDSGVDESHAEINLTEEQIADLNIKVRTILAHSCYSCHNATKTKGGLRLDKKEYLFKGGEDGPILVAGFPEKSDLIRRIKLPEGHDDAMPTKGKRLGAEEIDVLSFWIKTGATWPSGPEKSLYRVAELPPRIPELPPVIQGQKHPVDRLVGAYLKGKRNALSQTISDEQFIRRAYLDVIGLLPKPEEVSQFVLNKQNNKRDQLIDQLLNQNLDYAQHWLTFWNDLLRNDYAGPGYIDGGRSQIGTWIYQSLKSNKSFEVFVKELINPQKESEGFIKGIVWRGTVNSSQSPPMQAAQNVSQVFMGLNLKCASCHDSFISDWKLEDAYAFANVFSTKTLEIHKCDLPTGKMASYGVLYPALGKINSNVPTAERLKQLASLLVQKKNGRLYRTFVNRIWAQLMGRGIIEPLDAMDNVPWSQDLLDWLASDFANNGSDVKQLIRTIMTSKTYQMKTVGIKAPELLVASNFVFKGPLRRRLTGEQFADGVTKSFYPMYTDSMIAKKSFPKDIFKEIPFARASLVRNDAFLTALGRPTRENVTSSRNVQGNLLQALEMTNGQKFNQILFDGATHWVQRYPMSEQLVSQLYLQTLGRKPNSKELALAIKYIGKKSVANAIQDLAWAIFLLPEFQFIP